MTDALWGAPYPPRWYAAHIVRGERNAAGFSVPRDHPLAAA